MSLLIESHSEIDGYIKLLESVQLKGFKSNRYKEISNCLLSIEYNELFYNQFDVFKDTYLDIVGKSAKSAWNRAERVYTTQIDRMTKPSYLKRMRNYKDIYKSKVEEIDQIENIIYELASKPRSSILSFTIFRPVDLIDKKRQGYVPCPVAGDFKFRKGELQLNVFFRSHDALNFTYPDIFFLRQLQQYVLEQAKTETKYSELKKGVVGSINLHFSRVFIPLRMEMKKGEYINGPEIKEILKSLVQELKLFRVSKTTKNN